MLAIVFGYVLSGFGSLQANEPVGNISLQANEPVGNSLSCVPPELNTDDYYFCYDDASKGVEGRECSVRDGRCNDEYGAVNQGQTHSCETGYDCTDCGVYKVYQKETDINGLPMRYAVPGTGAGQGDPPYRTYRNFDCCARLCHDFHLTGTGCDPCKKVRGSVGDR